MIQRASFSHFEGCIQNPWDDIAIQYVLVCTHVAKKRYIEAFKEESQLVTCVLLLPLFIFLSVTEKLSG